MTTEQKESIIELNNSGYGKTYISRKLNISINTIKSFYKRNNIRSIKSDAKKCLYCGADVKQMPHRKVKKFCSDKCRMKWWNEHRSQINKKSASKYICPICKNEFNSYSARKYCSRLCYGISKRRKSL